MGKLTLRVFMLEQRARDTVLDLKKEEDREREKGAEGASGTEVY